MEKIVELKIEEIENVVGGVAVATGGTLSTHAAPAPAPVPRPTSQASAEVKRY